MTSLVWRSTIGMMALVMGLLLVNLGAQTIEVDTEHRLTVIETQVSAINDRLSRIETLGYGVVGASLVQIAGLFYKNKK